MSKNQDTTRILGFPPESDSGMIRLKFKLELPGGKEKIFKFERTKDTEMGPIMDEIADRIGIECIYLRFKTSDGQTVRHYNTPRFLDMDDEEEIYVKSDQTGGCHDRVNDQFQNTTWRQVFRNQNQMDSGKDIVA